MKRSHQLFAVLTLLVVLQSIFTIPKAEATPQRHVNPVPYYSQGYRPWCGVAVAQMVLAYVEYPKSPPTLEQLGEEMGATEKGTTGIDFELSLIHI